jgi:transcriptional regulator with GAF, ATPase, and Fis domain
MVQQVAGTDATVLVSGETGTGKELVARYIHSLSTRASSPFVPVSCAAIPEQLLESELFGHTRGAFTGAHCARSGMFQLADGGTLLLDEVAEMSLSLQAKLLRTLQDGEVKPIGADRPLQVNVRLIASTNKDLRQEVEKGSFREDIFYRLQVIPIHLPPLRARRSDIPSLVHHFLEKSNRKYGASTQISTEAMIYLWEYDWPGNVRELENLMERLVVLRQDDRIGPNSLPYYLYSCVSDKKFPQPELSNGGVNFKEAMQQFQYRLIDEALRRTNDNRTAAAQLLGLKRTTLVAMLRKGENGNRVHQEVA